MAKNLREEFLALQNKLTEELRIQKEKKEKETALAVNKETAAIVAILKNFLKNRENPWANGSVCHFHVPSGLAERIGAALELETGLKTKIQKDIWNFILIVEDPKTFV